MQELDKFPNKEHKPNFPPKIAHALKLCGGWYDLCLKDRKDFTWVEKKFVSAFENLLNIDDKFIKSEMLETGLNLQAIVDKKSIQEAV